MEKIRLGRTNMLVPRIGFGGIPIQQVSEDEAVAVVRRCLEFGVNYLDTATAYTTSQARVGKAIAGRPREGFFLASKSQCRDYEGMKNDIQNSLKTLGVAYLDLYQFHSVGDDSNYDTILGPGGAMQAALEAREAGRIRNIGISTHQIDIAKKAIKSGHFDTLMFPINFIIDEAEEELLPLAAEHDIGFIAIKALAGGRIKDNVSIAFKYHYQFPDIITVLGVDRAAEMEEALQVYRNREMSPAEREEMRLLKEKLSPRFCRHCDYCQPCTQGLPIAMLMDYEAMINALVPERLYTGPLAEAFAKAEDCDRCGKCEERCPYHMPVVEIITGYTAQYKAGKQKYEAGL
jgi:predicted aldo/keto reductase-like oxidoreductase